MVEDNNGIGFNLRMPARFSPGSVKAAAWMVLAEAGPEGLPVQVGNPKLLQCFHTSHNDQFSLLHNTITVLFLFFVDTLS